MNLKLIVAILVIAAVPVCARAFGGKADMPFCTANVRFWG